MCTYGCACTEIRKRAMHTDSVRVPAGRRPKGILLLSVGDQSYACQVRFRTLKLFRQAKFHAWESLKFRSGPSHARLRAMHMVWGVVECNAFPVGVILMWAMGSINQALPAAKTWMAFSSKGTVGCYCCFQDSRSVYAVFMEDGWKKSESNQH
ncbi:uncharacterized protein EI90DRAFT_627794 [Cantharellus anzutake]|uniref:uncharacterized protein n=1 Tax=Cantharellus anzutake TaxID=1750568 RepID=UPI001903EB4D|nr:uncharacterized protein EI90DRAFT_627794 [Cantharellus anzutake]KAF8333095.1 hypothetical protein EI90DRAFT_627794 [Cantharellus anzutake]